jgi:hypothetical protein
MFWESTGMYDKLERAQMTVNDFITPFSGKLDENNRWVKAAEIIPWDTIEDIYAKSFKSENRDGPKPISARIAFGTLYIKENEGFPQARTMQHISENIYMQYFLGLTEFNPEPLFDSSMLTYIAKRFSKEDMKKINKEIYRRSRSQDPPPDDDRDDNGNGCKNKGTMIVDATVAPADIRYPTDLSLLNECRENTEKIIDDVWDQTERVGHKTAYSRKKARKGYLKLAKQRKPRKKQIRSAIREQLEYLEKNVAWLEKVLQNVSLETWLKHWGRFETIKEILRQQKFHYDNPGVPVPNRIVSVKQPHVRPIVRGKARNETEFGQKINVSVVDGFTFVEKQSWDNFAEGTTLIASIEEYREMHGVHPKAILADTTYRNRENRNYCKERGIRLSGPRLGRPKASEIEADKEQAYQDSCDRNMVEGRIGINKRRYGLGLIYGQLTQTGEVEAVMNIICMNVANVLRRSLRLYFIRHFMKIFGSRRHRFAVC